MLDKILSFFEKLYHNVEIFEKIIITLKKLWNKIIYLIVLLLLIAIPIQSEALRNFVISRSNQRKIILLLCENYDLLFPVILLLTIFVFLNKLREISKIDVSIDEEIHQFTDNLHKLFIHDLRDSIRELDNNLEYINKGDNNVNKIIRKTMFQSLSNNMQSYVDFLSEYLSNHCGNTISVCIKIIKFENTNSNNEAITLARSSNTKRNRMKDDETVNIDENSDFKYLCNGRNTFFGKANLLKELENGNYNVAENVSVWSKKYNSTLIAPIRYYSKHSKNNNVNLDFEILGFLCIDSEQIIPEWEKNDSFELSVLAIFADSMYIYLKRYKEMYNNNMGDGT